MKDTTISLHFTTCINEFQLTGRAAYRNTDSIREASARRAGSFNSSIRRNEFYIVSPETVANLFAHTGLSSRPQ
ncbi:unnamed protein product [Macrosiphum euphorbiae]|uniref:Uncharacterized protein n=1 Tax=Macrosiphum euphorbiae TaxID=13131 RepID=A0AAV0XYK7_9HEMI|nr:unnamed protein product [Macrosiphum euphorbiae]